MHIAITGGAGFIGAALANELFKRGYPRILLLDNLSTGDWSRLEHEFDYRTIDISTAKLNELVPLLSGIDVLFHLSAVKLHNENNTFDDLVLHNVIGTQKLLEAAGKAGVKKVVFTSSLYAYGMPETNFIAEECHPLPNTIYGATKLFGEGLVYIASSKYGFDYTIARLFFIYGQKQFSKGGYKSVIVNNFEQLKSGRPAQINGDGKQILDYLHVSDCVDALIELSHSGNGEIFNVSSGIPLTIGELTEKMCHVTGVNLSVFAPPDWTHGTRRVGSNTKLKQLTGWIPRVSLEEGLNRTWSSLR